MDLKIIEKLFLLLVRSQLLVMKRMALRWDEEFIAMQKELEEQAKYLEERIKA